MLRQNSLKRAGLDKMNIKAETNEYYGGTHRSYLRVRKIQQLFDCSTALLLYCSTALSVGIYIQYWLPL